MSGKHSGRCRLGTAGDNLTAIFLAAFFCFLAIMPLCSQSAAAAPQETKTVVVGYFSEPSMMDGAAYGESKSGYVYDYLQEIASYAGWRYEYVYGDFATLYKLFFKGEIDLLPYVSYTEERARQFLFPERATTYEQFYLASRNQRKLSPDFSELQGAKVGVETGAFHLRLITGLMEQNHIECELVYIDTPEKRWKALADGMVDFSMESSLVLPNVDLWAVYHFNERFPVYLGINPKRGDLLREINQVNERLDELNPGFLGRLKLKYLKSNPYYRTLSAESEAWLKEHKSIRIGTFNLDEPYAIMNPTGSFSGILPEQVDMMMKSLRLGIPVEWKMYDSRQALINALILDEVDCINPYYHSYRNAEADGVVISNATYSANFSVLYNGEYNAETLSVIATPYTRLGEIYVRENYPHSRLVLCWDGRECIEKLKSGEATCVVLYTDVLESIARSFEDNFKIRPLNARCATCFAAMPRNAELMVLINKSAPFVTEVDLNAIENKYSIEKPVQGDFGISEFFRHHPGLLAGLIVATFSVIVGIRIKRKYDMVYAAELEAARQQAEKANKAKTTFLFNMSHDIRTPMNAVIGFTNMAKSNVDDKTKLLDCLDKTEQAGNLLLSLINGVLEISRIESGRARLEENPGKVEYSFENIRETMKEMAGKKDIELTFEFGEITDHFVYVDFDHAMRVFVNLISNAIKYTPAGGWVKVRCEQIGRNEDYGIYRYTVADNGIGMSEDFQKVLFDAFAREKNTTTSGVQGYGLGMSVVKSFVELLNGTIECDSVKGQGTTFTVTLPLKLQKLEGAEYTDPKMGELRTLSSDGTVKGEKFDLAGKRVLLVEDNDLNREVAGFILSEANLEFEEATDGTVAVELLQEKGPDYYNAVLMDIQMPFMNGYEATKAIREMYPKARLPIIALSANAFAEDKAASLAAGMNDHIAKPIDVDELMRVLSKFVSE